MLVLLLIVVTMVVGTHALGITLVIISIFKDVVRIAHGLLDWL